jgi:uncharacterized protein (TIGR00255 family)
MTAFSRQELQSEQGDLTWEVRSVNHRYLEVALRLDDSFRSLEMQIRKMFANKLGRGKIDAVLRYKKPQQQAGFEIDQDLAKSVIKGCNELGEFADDSAPVDMLRVLQWPGVIVADTLDQAELNKSVLDTLKKAIDELVTVRETEGTALQAMILHRCEEIEAIAKATRQRLPEILEQQRNKVQTRLDELQLELDNDRLEQEMVMLAQKTDVAEELDRLESHVIEVRNVIARDEPVGRRLDFLMQELNREANTLGSKSIDTDTTRYSVELKVLIEQMREQIQNIE